MNNKSGHGGHGHGGAEHHASTSTAAGKRSLTQRLAVQRAQRASSPSDATPSPASTSARAAPADDPFGLHLPIQRKGGTDAASSVHDAAAHGTSGTAGALPHADAIQRAFGRHDVSNIQAYTDGAAAEGAQAMGAEAFATGNDVAFAGAPSLHTAAHEAAHVVQQRGGVQLKGGVGEVGDAYEAHADAVADQVVQGRSAESLLDRFATTSTAPAGGAGAPVQHLKDIETGGKVFEQQDADQKRKQFGAVLKNLQLKLPSAVGTSQEAVIREQIRKLTEALAKYDLLPNTEAFLCVMPEQQPAVPLVLHIDLEFGDYRVGDEVAHGTYQFVILVKDPSRVLMAKGTGHQSIAGDNPVYYAGTAYFSDLGDLLRWNNDTGHYRTDVNHAPQATIPKSGGLPYLPLGKFEEFHP